MTRPCRILVLGASGRLGRMVQRHWSDAGLHPVWQVRQYPAVTPRMGDVVISDPLDGPPDCAPVDLVLGLAGIVPGKGDMSGNIDLGLAAVQCALELGARHVLLSSSAAVYGHSETPLCETALPRPHTGYGEAKLAMENAALALAADHALPATMLRIGNVAGADALLQQGGTTRTLDRFKSGQGPLRSFVGPSALATLLQALMGKAISGATLPSRLNVAQEGGVFMADLCDAAGLQVTWQPAPSTALERVVLDVTRLGRLVDVPVADARAIVADWHADRTIGLGSE